VGAEAMHDTFPWPGIIEDDPKAFAKAAVQLYKDEQRWNNAQRHASEIINSLYSKERLSMRLEKGINEIVENLQLHRQQNFIGSILQHHTMASTRFMSKWIEAKTQKPGS
jgi:hypothetical protein